MVTVFEQGDIVYLDFDLRSRHAAFEEKAPQDITAEAVDMITSFIEIR